MPAAETLRTAPSSHPSPKVAAALAQLRLLTALAPTPEALEQLAAWEAAVRDGSEPPAINSPPRPRAARTPTQAAKDQLRRALRSMPHGQALEVAWGDRIVRVAYGQRGAAGWYDVRDAAGRLLAEVETDLDFPGDRALGARRVLGVIERHADGRLEAAA